MRIVGHSSSAGPLLAVLGASAVVLALLACVLWLSLRSGNPGDPDAIYTLVNYSEIPGRALHLACSRQHAAIRRHRAGGLDAVRPARRMVVRAHRPARQGAAFEPDDGRAADPGISPRRWAGCSCCIRASVSSTAGSWRSSAVAGALQHRRDRRHGLGAGAQPGAARLHHDGRGVSGHGPVAGGMRGNLRRRPLQRRAARDAAARLARHPGGRHLYLHDRLRGLRRAGHHRLGQPHLHLLDLPAAAGQSRRRAAAIWPRRRAVDADHGARRGA